VAHGHVGSTPDLCCGSVGTAYAMLALARVDPARGWQRKARRLATMALVSEPASSWSHGLLKGEAGLLCLSVDLLTGGTRLPSRNVCYATPAGTFRFHDADTQP
jgi:hypothetical protein